MYSYPVDVAVIWKASAEVESERDREHSLASRGLVKKYKEECKRGKIPWGEWANRKTTTSTKKKEREL